MSLWDDAVNWVTGTYSDAEAAYEDLRDFLPGTIFVGDVPIPVKSTLDLMFGTSGQRGSTIEAYLTILAGARVTTPQTAQVVNSQAGPRITEDGSSMLLIPGCFQVAINAQSGGQAVTNVIGVQNAGGTALAAAQAVQAAWKATGGPLAQVASQLTMTDFTATDVGDANGDIAIVSDTTAGGLSGAVATNAACALISWNGSTRSRSSRGRLYLGPLTETQINSDGRTIASGSVTTLNNAFTTFRSSLASAGYPLVVLSRVLSASFPVTSHACEPVIATQRRRIR